MRIPYLYGFVAAALAAVTVSVSAQKAAQVDSSKLTTVLQTLATAVPQDDGRAVAQSRTPTARITRDALPKAVQDAMATRRLRMNDANEVQVYILMSAVNDERLAQLRAGGATIEIPDPARRRVQARVPATRLQSIAALPFVDFIRLPTYARHLSGLTTTEGDTNPPCRRGATAGIAGWHRCTRRRCLRRTQRRVRHRLHQLQRLGGRTDCHRRSARFGRCPKQYRCAAVVDRRHRRPIVPAERRSRGVATRGPGVWIRWRRRRRDGDA